jgi:hypothetical protein
MTNRRNFIRSIVAASVGVPSLALIGGEPPALFDPLPVKPSVPKPPSYEVFEYYLAQGELSVMDTYNGMAYVYEDKYGGRVNQVAAERVCGLTFEVAEMPQWDMPVGDLKNLDMFLDVRNDKFVAWKLEQALKHPDTKLANEKMDQEIHRRIEMVARAGANEIHKCIRTERTTLIADDPRNNKFGCVVFEQIALIGFAT